MLIAKDGGKRPYDVLATREWGRVPQPTAKLVERWVCVYEGIYSRTSGFGGSIEGCWCHLLAFLYNGKSRTKCSNCKGSFLNPFAHGFRLFDSLTHQAYWFYSFLTKHKWASPYFWLVSSIETTSYVDTEILRSPQRCSHEIIPRGTFSSRSFRIASSWSTTI